MRIKSFIFTVLFGFFFPQFLYAKIKIVTTLPVFASLASEVGKDMIEVKSLARGDQDPHFLEPKPTFTVLLSQADLLIHTGLELESGWLPVLLVQSRNGKIQNAATGNLDASSGIAILERGEGLDRSAGDVHPQGNPHYWLNPENGAIIAGQITERLIKLDPERSDFYRKNFENFKGRLEKEMQVWKKRMVDLKEKRLITYHKSWSYFVNWAGLEVAGYLEAKPGISPNSKHLALLIEQIKREKITLILAENYYDLRPAKKVALESGAKFLEVPSMIEGNAAVKNYFDLFDFLTQKISENLKE